MNIPFQNLESLISNLRDPDSNQIHSPLFSKTKDEQSLKVDNDGTTEDRLSKTTQRLNAFIKTQTNDIRLKVNFDE